MHPRRFSEELARLVALAVEQHGHGLAHALAVEFKLLHEQQRLQLVQACVFFLLGNDAAHGRTGGAGARAVLEGIAGGVARLAHDFHRLLVVFFRLAGEADDEVGAERDIGARLAEFFDDVDVKLRRMLAVHQLQHAVGAALQGQMQERHQLVDAAVRGDKIVVHVLGVGGHVADALEAFHVGQLFDDFGKIPCRAVGAFAVIGVDVLAEQHDFLRALVDHLLRFFHHLRDGAGEFGAARIGHDAEGAELVAAFLH